MVDGFAEDCAAQFVPCWDYLVGYFNDNTIQCLRMTIAVTEILTASTFIPFLLSLFATIVNATLLLDYHTMIYCTKYYFIYSRKDDRL